VNERPSDKDWDEIPFGALEAPPGYTPPTPKKAPTPAADRPPVLIPLPDAPLPPRTSSGPANAATDEAGGRRSRRARWRDKQRRADGPEGDTRPEGAPQGEGRGAEGGAPKQRPGGANPQGGDARFPDGTPREGRRRRRRSRRNRNGGPDDARFDSNPAEGAVAGEGVNGEAAPDAEGAEGATTTQVAPRKWERRGKHGQDRGPAAPRAPAQVMTGMFVLEKGGWGVLRRLENQYLPSKEDIFVPQHLVQRNKLRDGALVAGPCGKGTQSKYQLLSVDTVDDKDPREVANVVAFKKLTSIDPDFHYAVGDVHGDVSMRVLDVICPVGRGSRGLIVAPPRSGKTILMRKFANSITEAYPEVHLIVLLIDERPEEATEWKRTTRGQVFVSTNDEDTKNHVELAEAVFKRCQRLVELGQDVVLLLDSITRLARAYNNHAGTSGKTMSGGLDSRAMERPRSFFGMARNTETAGSLTILGTTLVETGSRLDQMVFEEFKGTGNMEIVLSRKLADRRIFPAIDIERSGTRKDEKLHSATRLRRIHTLRRVLMKMNFIEAMELLITKLEDVDKIDDFLKRFDTDPEA